MSRRIVLVVFLITSVLLAIAQSIAFIYFEPGTDVWYSKVPHFLGGMCVALAALYLMVGIKRSAPLTAIVSIVLVVGLVWEIWEWYMGFRMDTFDTVTDVIADALGGVVAWWSVYRKS